MEEVDNMWHEETGETTAVVKIHNLGVRETKCC